MTHDGSSSAAGRGLRPRVSFWASRLLALLLLTALVFALSLPTVTQAAVGGWTPADVDAAVARGVAYIDSTQNADGSFGSSFPPAETAFAIIAYGVLDEGDINNLPSAMQTHLQNAVTYLLSQQSADGSFGCSYCTYTTGLALDALSSSTGVDPGIPAAISSGRAYLISTQNAPPAVTGNPSSPNCSGADQPPPGSGTDTYCGGWNYDAGFGRSDESNTGFALTGLQLTGGVPAATASYNVDWQRHVQELTATNYFAARNDGGGDYEPGISFGSFSSNANDTGSLLFGYGYDGVAGSDPKVQAALTFGTDVLDVYGLTTSTRVMVFHTGMAEDGACDPAVAGCDWAFAFGEGGYHYSLWSLTKGFGLYIPHDLSDPSNWYAKVVDLLLTQQNADGSWPVDGRDDFTSIVSTSFAVDALGLVGVPTLTVTKAGSGSGTVTSSPAGIDCGATCSAKFPRGTALTLTATPDAGSTFTGWGGDCTGTGPCVVTMDQDQAVTATFDVGPPTLTVTKAGSGSGTVTSSPAGIDCGATCAASFSNGTIVTLTATPDAGSTFTGWGGDCTGTGPCVVTMDQDRAVTATFDIAPATPRVLKQDAVASLQALLPTGDEQADRKIQRAIHEINETLEPQLWLDNSHLADKGRRVFHEEKEAARALTRILNPPTVVASVLDSLVAADETLARTAIDEATASGGDPGILAEAENQMQRAAEELANGHLPEAIEHYGRAWKKAQQSLM
jgi:Divergent InlB B-repeat domain/Prenyltransferase and squalene oxidase repeat